MAVFPINSLQLVCDAHMEISFETYHTDDCKAGVPGPNKVRRLFGAAVIRYRNPTDG